MTSKLFAVLLACCQWAIVALACRNDPRPTGPPAVHPHCENIPPEAVGNTTCVSKVVEVGYNQTIKDALSLFNATQSNWTVERLCRNLTLLDYNCSCKERLVEFAFRIFMSQCHGANSVSLPCLTYCKKLHRKCIGLIPIWLKEAMDAEVRAVFNTTIDRICNESRMNDTACWTGDRGNFSSCSSFVATEAAPTTSQISTAALLNDSTTIKSSNPTTSSPPNGFNPLILIAAAAAGGLLLVLFVVLAVLFVSKRKKKPKPESHYGEVDNVIYQSTQQQITSDEAVYDVAKENEADVRRMVADNGDLYTLTK